MSAADVDATTGEQFTMPVNAKGTVADADKDNKVRFYGVIPGLSAEDINLAEIEGGTPEIVTDETERGYAGAGTGDLVLAWGPAGGFPLGEVDYSGEGATTNFAATINKTGSYEVTFVFYGIDGQKRLNGEDETATITVTDLVDTITLEPDTGEATVVQGAELEASEVTLSSNYDAAGLKTFISLKKGDAPVNFDTVFEEFNLATKVGDKEVELSTQVGQDAVDCQGLADPILCPVI